MKMRTCKASICVLGKDKVRENRKRGATLSRRPPLLVVTNVYKEYSTFDCQKALQNRQDKSRLDGLNPNTGGSFALSQ